MNATDLLQSVAEAYANLKSFEVELLIIKESVAEGSIGRNESPARAFYVAPDRVRLEHGGRGGMVLVSDGSEVHSYFAGPNHYHKRPVSKDEPKIGSFRPEFPILSSPIFLFDQIADRLITAEWLRDESASADGEGVHHVLSVTYNPAHNPPFIQSAAPLTFWVNSQTRMIDRAQGEAVFKNPIRNHSHTEKVTFEFTGTRVNEDIPAATFTYEPPPDAEKMEAGMGFAGGAGSGSGGGGRNEWRTNHRTEGDTFVERSNFKLQGFDLIFERRLTISDDRRSLHVVERVIGPAGETDQDFSVPLASSERSS